MKSVNVPRIGLRYWAILCLASIAGCNSGDFVAFYLHFGTWRGLAPLALLLALLVWGEARSRWRSEFWYWAAILVIRTAATNFADLSTHTLRLPYPWVIVGFETLLVLTVLPVPARAEGVAGTQTPPTGGFYWLSMMVAGALGTAIGDCVEDYFHLGSGLGTLALLPPLLLVWAAGMPSGWRPKAAYWFAVVMIRAAGTAAGDYLGFSGLGMPIQWATLASVGVMALAIAVWPRGDRAAAAVG
jgi:uncharacterized membrane-anchored protein